MTDEELIARYITIDPRYTGSGDVRLRDSGIHVWAIIGQLAASGWDSRAVADEYGIKVDEVEAARAYYRHNHDAIDGRLAANGDWPLPPAAAVPS
jgi:uncharacterized protein (DUF433 family)